ncbi:MAG: PEP-CTERM sorting domain-containing protein [Pirellulales bacterium]
MFNLRLLRVCFLAWSVAIVWTSARPAHAIILNAIQDTWIRSTQPDNDFNDDLISVWNRATPELRNGAVLFDLSSTVGVPITSAYLQLFDRNDTRSRTQPINQQTFILTVTPVSPQFAAPYTWNEYVMFDQANEVSLDSLGAYNIAVGDLVNGYEPSSLASTADITKLEQARDGNANLVGLILKATAGERDWGDIEFEGAPPRLVINEPLPVLGDFNDDFMVTIDDFNVMIDPLNWLQNVLPGTRGDITTDGLVSLADFGMFKPIYQAANPAAASLELGTVPEPSSTILALVGVAIISLAFAGRRQISSRWRTAAIVTTMLFLLLVPTIAQAVVLDAIGDVWFRELQPDMTFEGDLVSVWNSHSTRPQEQNKRRYGVVEFDVSSLDGMPINLAKLNLWNFAHGSSDQSKAIKQSAVFINTTGGTAATALTWNIYQNEYAGSAVPLAGLGAYDLPAQTAPGAYSTSAAATLADRAVISSASSSGNQRLTLVLIADESTATEYAHTWGDGEFGTSMSPQLVINEELVQLTLRINSATGAISIVNPGVDPTVNSVFDIDGYVIHSPAGALNSAGFTGISGTGQPGWQIVSPTASDLSELNLTSSTMFSEGNTRSLGTGYIPGAPEDAGLTFNYNLAGGATVVGLVEYVSGGLDGDYNGDGTVDAADYVIWRKGGSPDSSQAGYNLWRANFGQPLGSGATVELGSISTVTAVPEPTTFGLLALVLALVLVPARRRLS